MALAAYVAAVNKLQQKLDLEPILKHFGKPQRTMEKELGFEALDLRIVVFVAIAFYTIPGLIMVVSKCARSRAHAAWAQARLL